MAIVSTVEMLGMRTGSIDASWRRSYRRAWRVTTDSVYTGALAIRQAIPVSLGKRYEMVDDGGVVVEHDNFAFAIKIDVAIEGGAEDDLSWVVTVDYGAYDPTQFPENPLNQPIKISWGLNRFERVVEETIEDKDGNTQAILNSAGDYFDPPVTCDDSRPTLRIIRNEKSFDAKYADAWKDTLNKKTFFGFDPGTVKMTMPTGDLEYNPVCGFFYPVTYEFEINPDGWRKKILDQGMRTADANTGDISPCVDKDGNPVTTPVLLDGSGGQLQSGDDPFYMEFDIYNEADFGVLNLDPKGAPGQGDVQ